MRTVEHDGDSYLLVKRSEESSLVRDPETGEERYLPNGELVAAGGSSLALSARRVPEPTRRLLTAVRSERALGVLLELDERGPLSVRTVLGEYDLCESDLTGCSASSGPRGWSPRRRSTANVATGSPTAAARGWRRCGRSYDGASMVADRSTDDRLVVGFF